MSLPGMLMTDTHTMIVAIERATDRREAAEALRKVEMSRRQPGFVAAPIAVTSARRSRR